MSEFCCSNCVPVLLQTYREKQELELLVTRQKAEISRLAFAQLLRDSQPAATAGYLAGPEALAEEMIRKYEATRVPRERSSLPKPLRVAEGKSKPGRTHKRKVRTAQGKKSLSRGRREEKERTMVPTRESGPKNRRESTGEERRLKHSSSLMSPLKESDLKSVSRPLPQPLLYKSSIPPLRDLLLEAHDSVPSSQPAFTLEELKKSKPEDSQRDLKIPNSSIGECFLPVYERNGSLFTASGSSIRLGELLSSSSTSPTPLLHVFPTPAAALQGSPSALLRVSCLNSLYTYGSYRLRDGSSLCTSVLPTEVLRLESGSLSLKLLE